MDNEAPVAPSGGNAYESATKGRTLLLAGGLLGTCVVFLASLLNLPHADIDAWLTAALYLFVGAMPCLGYVIAVETVPQGWVSKGVPDNIRGWFVHGEDAMRSTPQTAAGEIGPIVAIIGVAAVVGHLSFPAFVFFVATIVIILVLYSRAFSAARKASSSVRQSKQPSKEGESR